MNTVYWFNYLTLFILAVLVFVVVATAVYGIKAAIRKNFRETMSFAALSVILTFACQSCIFIQNQMNQKFCSEQCLKINKGELK